jgi:hypothetical protein
MRRRRRPTAHCVLLTHPAFCRDLCPGSSPICPTPLLLCRPLARQAPLRDEYAPAREERVADVYPFPRNGERRTIQIKGQTVPPPRRRRTPAATRVSARPDRLALWAVVLGLVMIAIAAATAHGQTPHAAAPAAHVAHIR